MKNQDALLDSLPQREAAFIQPMECLAVTKLPDGADSLALAGNNPSLLSKSDQSR